MQFPESWLRSIVNPNITSDDLAEKLTMAGLEVENISSSANASSNKIISVKILDLSALSKVHDNCYICTVDCGPLHGICYAISNISSVRSGMIVPMFWIEPDSPVFNKYKSSSLNINLNGIICSSEELGVFNNINNLFTLDNDFLLGIDLNYLLNIDNIFTIKLTPNRADCLSILGLAREVSAITDTSINIPKYKSISESIKDFLPIDISSNGLCGHYSGRVIRNVDASLDTPIWIRSRLENSGQKSISVLVDISNYLMLEFGIPSHIYDLDSINGSLSIRWSRNGESISLIDGKNLVFDEKIGVVSDNNGPICLAGIMGGKRTSVDIDTKNIFVESAFWFPDAILGKSRLYKINSESAYRFERGVDYSRSLDFINTLTSLIVEICGGVIGPVSKSVRELPNRNPVKMRLSRCKMVLGIYITINDISIIFTKLGFSFKESNEVFIVDPPAYRFDISIEEDLIEEVARMYGYDNIPVSPPLTSIKILPVSESKLDRHYFSHLMADRGYQEVINYSFVDPEWERIYYNNLNPIKILNPISSNLSVMRSGLIAGLVNNIIHNANRQLIRARVFEIGRVFIRDSSIIDSNDDVAGIRQSVFMAGAAWGSVFEEQWGLKKRLVDFYDVKSDVESLLGDNSLNIEFKKSFHSALHPGRTASLVLSDNSIAGWIGELSPKITFEAGLSAPPIVFEIDLRYLINRSIPYFKEYSRQPVVTRDLSIWLDCSIEFQSIKDIINILIKSDDNISIVKDFIIFDVWNDINDPVKKQKSIAMRFYMQDTKTLDEERVSLCMSLILDKLIQVFNVSQRA
ncbi:phenylalanyl-tRNA synthetase beta chain [Candidatus Kinetoplastibacterium blastocrithidii TCC012E]|uniref:Phenylalanine--tRNA ligase beta subunit n=1 Tax=Candidatus Kinetoplastidibacterium blastocrithidiae TCC012E TaxID=1208922 RepID=M1LW00_9PROT|nr:phenylalanine--tRNA ligase subunit beta [Candidatus Kinetoplastibacterium blastocrithidii]AFZ83606.1 phenylalanyl-tRNA synthetase subunit beta [Candidatus Kinetoplastibacterium blastocrithidii (ex Strigomonas culicis)]AGF49727.1 phenylalanyl-tRNA synthetase beta chain [Candidatus Kinetoplastibacterium blastocrithidii TCC012E]